jgi:hypothetical protein
VFVTHGETYTRDSVSKHVVWGCDFGNAVSDTWGVGV